MTTTTCPTPDCRSDHPQRSRAAIANAIDQLFAIADRQPTATGKATALRNHLALLQQELRGYCCSCSIMRVADANVAREASPTQAEIEQAYVSDTEAAMAAATDPRTLCVVIPLRPRATGLVRDLLIPETTKR